MCKLLLIILVLVITNSRHAVADSNLPACTGYGLATETVSWDSGWNNCKGKQTYSRQYTYEGEFKHGYPANNYFPLPPATSWYKNTKYTGDFSQIGLQIGAQRIAECLTIITVFQTKPHDYGPNAYYQTQGTMDVYTRLAAAYVPQSDMVSAYELADNADLYKKYSSKDAYEKYSPCVTENPEILRLIREYFTQKSK